MTTLDTPTQPENEPKKSNAKKAVLVSVLALGLFLGGGFTGAALADPTKSDEYVALAGFSDAFEESRDSYKEQLGALSSKHDTLTSELAEREGVLEKRESAVSEKEAAVSEAEAAVESRETAVGTAEAEAEANSITDGTWTVGEDIKAGTYRAASAVNSDCYWAIYRSGSNGADIIDNDIPGGGRPTVKLSKGQDFKSSNCGDWQKK